MSPAAALAVAPTPNWLDRIELAWRPIVGRDLRPIGVHLAVADAGAGSAPLAEILAGVLDGFTADDAAAFPRGLVVLAPHRLAFDESLEHWRAPRNVLLEVGSEVLAQAAPLERLKELQRQGMRLALRIDATPPPAGLSFQYVVAPVASAVTGAGGGVLITGARTRGQAQAAFDNGAHAMVGWPLEEPVPDAPGSLQPIQKAVLELIRLLQAEADAFELQRAFAADPVLTYLLLTLANSAAFRRGQPIGSIGAAITLLGYKRLLKWLVLLLVIASKRSRALPQIFAAVTRGFFMENVAEVQRRPLRDDCFVTGAFSLLARITGVELQRLFDEVALPRPVVQAVLEGAGPLAPLLEQARALEGDRPTARQSLPIELKQTNTSLLMALACADALQSLV